MSRGCFVRGVFCPTFAYYRSPLFRSSVCHKYCMAVTSRLYRSSVGRSAIPYCNSDVVIKVGGRQVASVNKLYDCHVTNLQVFLLLCICQLPTCLPLTCPPMFTDYHRPVYRRPVFLLFCICQLPTCLPPTCPPMSTDYRRPVYRRTVFLLLCICQLPTCLPPTCPPMSPDYRRPVFLLLCICQLPTCLPPTCLPPTCLSIIFYLPTDYRRPIYRLPVFLFLCICQLPSCLPPTCLPFTCISITLYLPTAYLSSADLSIYVH